MTKLHGWKKACAVSLFCAIAAIASPAQTFTTLLDFDGADGTIPYGPLVQGFDGEIYGTTESGFGAEVSGTVFKITSGGALTRIQSLCSSPGCLGGWGPRAGLVQGTDGNFYGTTAEEEKGGSGGGTVFKITPGGVLTTLYSFCSQPDCADGTNPTAGLVLGADGEFYGTTSGGGFFCGTVFKITAEGKITTLHTFNCSDGAFPLAGLVQATNGDFYGTTFYGGENYCNTDEYSGCGTIFKITAAGKFTSIYSFCSEVNCSDGSAPAAGLVQGRDGDLYGTTAGGGANRVGTVFKVTPTGTLTTLHRFAGYPTDGEAPYAGLAQATDGNFYGTTLYGGANCEDLGCGTVFKITPGGVLTTLYSFCSQPDCADGYSAYTGLAQATNGDFYGTTLYTGTGGIECYTSHGCGTIFSLSTGLGPFVSFVRDSGKVGQTGPILGQGFTGTTGVFLNGTRANFTVVSDTYLQATVPVGATTGFVTVETPSGTLTSNVPFHVIPEFESTNLSVLEKSP